MVRQLNWIDGLVSECGHVETPQSWLWWSFLSCISAAAGNNYYLTTLKGDLVYKPNLYIMLLGESGLGKGFPINRAKLLVSKANVTRVVAGRSSIQAIVSELATSKTVEGKPLITDSRGYIVNGELSTAIIQDPDSLTILTDLYDGHYNPEWTNLLKGSGAEKLKNPYITALFGSSPAHFYDSIPQANIEGGYIGRNLIIYEEKRSKDVDLLDDEPQGAENNKFDDFLVPKYVPHLEKVAKHKGQLVPNDAARKLFNTWRKKWRASQTHDKTGFLNRVPDHVLKVSMCLTLSNYEFTGEISEVDIEEAIMHVTNLVYSNKRTTEGRGPDPLAAATKIVIDYLIAAPQNELTKKVLLWKGYGTYNSFSLDQIMENLLEMGWIKRVKIGVGSNMDWLVKLHGEPLDSYLKYVKDKEKK
jgi:hypothetical protein